MMYRIDVLPALVIGRQDDNGVDKVSIDCSAWADNTPALTDYRVEMSIGGVKFAPLRQSYSNGVLMWKISDNDTAVAGEGRYEIVATGRDGQQKTSASAPVYVNHRIPGRALAVPPDYVQPLLDRIAEMLAGVGGGSVTPEQIQQAVDSYLTQNPVQIAETDPTVPDWAKQPQKPSYTAQEVGALPADAEIVDNTARQGVAENAEGIERLSEEIGELKENGGAGVAVDATLSESGKAADAAVTGQKIAELDNAAFVLTAGKNLFNPATAEVGAIQSDGSVSAVGSYAGYLTSDYIEVDQQTDYAETIVTYDATGTVTSRKYILLFDGQKNIIGGTYQNVNGVETLTFNTGNAHYVRMSGYVGTGEYPYKLQLEQGSVFTGYEAYTSGEKKLREPYPDILRGKKWVVIGDSFTQGGYRETDGFDESAYKFQSGKYAGNNITYPYIIAERTNLDVISFFNGGRTLANPADDSFTNSITNPNCAAYYQNVPGDADYITIYLGINDSHHEAGSSGTDGEDVTGVIPLGTIDDTDTSTFCGAWNVVLPWLMTNRPNAHIGIIVSNGVERVEYRAATIAAAKKWGIPYLDLNGDERCPAMIRTVNPDISDAAKDILKAKWGVTTENLHPNTAAQRFQSTFIENFLRTL